MMWQARIHDPSGETRIIPLKKLNEGSLTVGRGDSADIPLRDPLASISAAMLWQIPSHGSSQPTPFWIQIPPDSAPALIGDLQVREAQIPLGLPIRLGESEILIEPHSTSGQQLPPLPSNTRPWLTVSEAGRRTLWTTRKSSSTPLSIYLAGETGTGKEVLAHLIHAWSDRSSGPFVPLHCGALPLSLAESELFGHVKGAFTGASHHRAGALMQAHGGTLFLDEVGDLPLDIQVKLLRFLENGEIRPIGADRTSRADVRVLCATHHPLQKWVDEGKFRRDLYYRLASVTIHIPALRERPEDIELLAVQFASELKRSLSPRAILRLQAHSWPGNVRELRHSIERACGLAGPFSSILNEDAFEFLLTPDSIENNPNLELGSAVLSLDEMERAMLLKALRLSGGHRGQAAQILGVARSTLFEMLKRHRVQGPKSKPRLNSI